MGAYLGNYNICIGRDSAVSATDVSNEITLGNTSITKFRIPGLDFSISADGTVTSTSVSTGSVTASSVMTAQDDVDITYTGSNLIFGPSNKIRWNSDDNNAYEITLKAPTTLTKDSDYILPEDGSSGEYLKTDGSGNLSWAEVDSGAPETLFIGFSRASDGTLSCTYSEVTDSITYKTSDYEHRGGAQWMIEDNGSLHTTASLARLGSYTRPDGTSPAVGEPKYHINSAGHLILTV